MEGTHKNLMANSYGYYGKNHHSIASDYPPNKINK